MDESNGTTEERDGAGHWRVDDLARHAGLSVDTVRFYQRGGLLPPPIQIGRARRYGREHLARLRQIRDLQARRFSLAAIRAIIEQPNPSLVAGLFGDETNGLTREELLERSGVGAELLDRLHDLGVIGDPRRAGDEGRRYQASDLQLLQAVAGLRAAGITDAVIAELVAISLHHLEAMGRESFDLLIGERSQAWTPEEHEAFLGQLESTSAAVADANSQVVHLLHSRAVQRLALNSLGRLPERPLARRRASR